MEGKCRKRGIRDIWAVTDLVSEQGCAIRVHMSYTNVVQNCFVFKKRKSPKKDSKKDFKGVQRF